MRAIYIGPVCAFVAVK